MRISNRRFQIAKSKWPWTYFWLSEKMRSKDSQDDSYSFFGHRGKLSSDFLHWRLGQEMGVDEHPIKTTQIYEFWEGSDLIPPIWAISPIRFAVGNWPMGRSRRKLKNKCWRCGKGQWLPGMGKWSRVCFDKDCSMLNWRNWKANSNGDHMAILVCIFRFPQGRLLWRSTQSRIVKLYGVKLALERLEKSNFWTIFGRNKKFTGFWA